jgi:glycyl-tRNA synthetase
MIQPAIVVEVSGVTRSFSFQDVIMRLQQFWAEQNCVIWQPYYTQVGAGTMNPATFLRVLGPEPWNVAYVEPSVRPDDGRYGDNPNRMQFYYQYQVILKPDPGNPQELYLASLEALGIDRRKHDIRFVEDKWESPALGAWGLGWEVWLDGQEITQFTYFQQAGGQELSPVSVEITYGIERIVLALQGVDAVWDMEWTEGLTYGQMLFSSEVEHCTYYFDVADVNALRAVYNTYEQEAERALSHEPPLVMPAHDYVLKCSHLFNVLDTRGAIGVVERADYFRRMQRMAARVAGAYVRQRQQMEYPWLREGWEVSAETGALTVPAVAAPKVKIGRYPARPAPFLLEIGTEELPWAELNSVLGQLGELVPAVLNNARLDYEAVRISGTPRRLVVYVEGLAPSQLAQEITRRGPPVRAAYDAAGNPTSAAVGFARSQGVAVEDLERRQIEGGEYVAVTIREEGRRTADVLAEVLPQMIGSISCDKPMRWNMSGVAFSRPIRWLVALFDKAVIPFTYAGVHSGRTTRGTRPLGSPPVDLGDVDAYFEAMAGQGILIDPHERRAAIRAQIDALAAQAGGVVLEDPDLLDEVTNLVEQPTALLGTFSEDHLRLPEVVLITVMKKHQRYFAVVGQDGRLLPAFIAVRNGDSEHLETVARGNEHVIRARFADAQFFYRKDAEQRLADHLARLKTLTFQQDIGSYYDKAVRLEGLTARIGALLGLQDGNGDLDLAIRAARLAKADLVTRMVVEMTSLQGQMGRVYALQSGEPSLVADAIAEHYHPRYAGDSLPQTRVGIAIALADRLDSLVGLFSVGMQPTGSTDPYGLRRAALGLVQILIGHHIALDLRQAVEWAAMGFTREMGEAAVSGAARQAVLDFIAGRLRVLLRETFRHDIVEAVTGQQGHNPYQAHVNAHQLTGWVSRDGWENVLDAYARCVRITRSQPQTFTLRPEAFEEAVEKALYAAYRQAAAAVGSQPDVNQLLAAIEPMVPAISAFFASAEEGGVLVMHPDSAVRENRLALLQHIAGLAQGVADLSALEGF